MIMYSMWYAKAIVLWCIHVYMIRFSPKLLLLFFNYIKKTYITTNGLLVFFIGTLIIRVFCWGSMKSIRHWELKFKTKTSMKWIRKLYRIAALSSLARWCGVALMVRSQPLYTILPRLLQRSKKCRGHYSTLYHATSQWIMRMWGNPYIWSSKSCQLHVDFTSQLWCWLCIFRISM